MGEIKFTQRQLEILKVNNDSIMKHMDTVLNDPAVTSDIKELFTNDLKQYEAIQAKLHKELKKEPSEK